MKKIGVFFICLFVLGCNPNDEPTIKNKCNRVSDHSNISFMPDFLKGKIPTNDDT